MTNDVPIGVPTAAEIEAARSPAGGWSRATLESWGVPWPPPKGWRKALLGVQPPPAAEGRATPEGTTRLEVRIRYDGHGLWVHPSLLGWSGVVERDGVRLEVRLPAGPRSFSARPHEVQAGLELVPSAVVAPTYGEPGRDHTTVAVHLFSVSAFLERDLAPERPRDPFEGEYGAAAQAAFAEGKALCDALAHDFMRWVRASTRQPWLGLVADPPRQYGRGGLFYAGSGQDIFGIGPTQVRDFTSSRSRVEQGDLEELLPALASQSAVPVAQELLADAWHVSTGAVVPDLNRAVLLAAMACEIRTKDFLRRHVEPGRRPLLDLALRRTSTLKILLHDVVGAALGTSLKDADRTLYDRIDQLTVHRNNVVHTGRAEGLLALQGGPAQIAQDLFDWFDTFTPGTGGATGL